MRASKAERTHLEVHVGERDEDGDECGRNIDDEERHCVCVCVCVILEGVLQDWTTKE